MSKPNPFYRNEKEKQELVQMRDSFTFSDPEEASKLVILISGREGSGKTHLACTMSQLEPVYLIDTEYRAQVVTRKFKDIKFTTAKNFLEMAVAVKAILKHQPPGTIIIDSGSDLQTFAEIEYLERSEKERVGLPYNWSEVWRLCNAIIDDIKFSRRFNLVLTARVKEEYLNEKPTGQVVPRIYSALPYKADLTLQFTGDKERKLLVTKNGFTGDISLPVSRTEGLPSIIDKLQRGIPTAADAAGKETLRKAS